jgi:hypothetical protein
MKKITSLRFAVITLGIVWLAMIAMMMITMCEAGRL